MWQMECIASTLNTDVAIKKILKNFNWHLKKSCQLLNIKKNY